MKIEKNWKQTFSRRAVSAAAALILTGTLLAGCSLPGARPTAVSLAKNAVQNMQEAKSADVQTEIGADIAMKVSSINLSLNMDLDVDMDMEMTKDPMLAKGTAEVRASVLGQNRTLQSDFYLDASDGGSGTTYIRWNDGDWSKKKNAEDAEGGSGSQADENEQETETAAGGSFPGGLLQSVSLLKMIAEEAMEAELKEETVTIRDQEAWQIVTTLHGPLLKEVLSRGGNSAQLEQIDWENVEIPAEIYIYKDRELPARISLECRDIAAALLEGSMDQYTDSFPFGELSAEADSCTVSMTFDRYDEIDPISIPQEALEGGEVDSLVPDLADLLEGLF